FVYEIINVKQVFNAAHFVKKVKRLGTRADVPRHSLRESYRSSLDALRTDKTLGFGTSATVPSDAWERCPNPGVVSGSGMIHRASPMLPKCERRPSPGFPLVAGNDHAKADRG